jgi:Leucine-rich repeat (LRR) protein
MIAFSCSQCGKNLKVKQDLAGKKGKCPHCGHAVRVPLVSGSTEAIAGVGAGLAALHRGPLAAEPAADLVTLPPTPSVLGVGAAAAPPVRPELYDFLAPPQAPDELGRLGPYRVLKVLGAGGMGVVYEAEDPVLRRHVALKALLPHLAGSPSARQRFLREAQAAAALSHDHIVTVHQVGEDRGVPYVAMPLLRGEPLDERLRREGKQPVAEVLRIGRETAEGLAAAHERGLIHRDIKPANIFLEGDRGRVKILDFGLARVTADESHLTQQGAIIGTPAYMAPEQANCQPLDGRCDLFGLGCVLYRTATGELPFKGKDTLSTLMAVATEQPMPPRALNPAVPSALSGLIMRLLAKKPDDRPASARAVAEAFAALERDPAALAVASVRPVAPLAVRPQVEREEDADTQPHGERRVPPIRSKARPTARRVWPWLAGAAAALAVLSLLAILVWIVIKRSHAPTDHAGEVAESTPETAPKEGPANPGGQRPIAGGPGVERRAAVWVLNLKGQVGVTPRGGKYYNTNAVGSLPRGAFLLHVIHFENNQQVTDEDLRQLEGLADLVELNLPNTSITDAGLEHLRSQNRLRRLNLNNTQVTEAGVQRLQAALPQCRIACDGIGKKAPAAGAPTADRTAAEWALNLGGRVAIVPTEGGSFVGLDPVDGREDQMLPGGRTISVIRKPAALPKAPFRVEIIDLNDNKLLTDQDLKAVERLTGLRSLLLSGTAVSDLGLDLLRGLRQLEELDVTRTAVSAAGAQRLQEALPGCEINTGARGQLPFAPGPTSDSRPVPWCLKNIGMQTGNGSKGEILQISVPRKTVTDAHLARLSRLKSVASLRGLELNGTQITDAGLAHLRELNLHSLNLSGTNITDAGLVYLKGLDDLQSVDLSGTRVTGTGLEQLKDMPRLQKLSLKDAPVADAGLKDAAALTKLNRLQLDLTGTQITDAGLEHLQGLTNLRMLGLSRTRITDAGLKHLKGLAKLENLALSGTKVTGAGLDPPEGLANLGFLFLNETPIADADLEHLKGYTKLGYLDLKKTHVTKAGAEQLKKALPRCNIDW